MRQRGQKVVLGAVCRFGLGTQHLLPRERLRAYLLGLLAFMDIDEYAQPFFDAAAGVANRHPASEMPAEFSIGDAPEPQFGLEHRAAKQGMQPALAHAIAIFRMDLFMPPRTRALRQAHAAVLDPVLVDIEQRAVAAGDPDSLR